MAVSPIGREAAQRLARDELSKPIYHQQSLSQYIEHWVSSLLGRLFADASSVTPGGWWTLVALAALVVAAVALIAARLGPVARSARKTGPASDLGSRAMTARQLRDAAAASAAAGDYAAAIVARLRAIAAACEERGILIRNAGETADELAAAAGARFPGQSADLAAAARLFDQVRYGGGAGSPDGYERLRQLDEALASQQPTPVHGTEPAILAGRPASVARAGG
jgi:Domain of unknown function (DUF4129)